MVTIKRGDFIKDIRTKKEKRHWNCFDCDKDTWQDLRDYYMVEDDIWDKYAPGLRVMLCLKCLEKRLGHKLGIKEITFCPLNLDNPYTFKIIKKVISNVKKQ